MCVCALCICTRRGADKEAKNLDGKTALEVAELNEQQEVIDALKNAKAEVKTETKA